MTDFLKIAKSIVVHFAHICAYGVETVKHGSKPGVCTALTFVQEKSLVNYLLYMAVRGFPLTRTMVKAFAWAIAKRSGSASRFNDVYGPSDHWWQLFKKRHPILTLRRADSQERGRKM